MIGLKREILLIFTLFIVLSAINSVSAWNCGTVCGGAARQYICCDDWERPLCVGGSGAECVYDEGYLGLIGDACYSDSQCNSGYCGPEGTCELSDLPNGAPCSSGKSCLSGYCDANNQCANVPPVQCTSWTYNADWSTCSNGQQTQTATGSPAGCVGNPDPNIITRQCTAANGGTCNLGNQCLSGYCDANNQCANAPQLKANGITCSTNSECQSNYCNPQTLKCENSPTYCTGGWTCTRWGPCNADGTKSCYDANGTIPAGCSGVNPWDSPPYWLITSTQGCPQPTHSECSNYACTSVAGSGTNACSSDLMCKEENGVPCSGDNECQSGQCSWSWAQFKNICTGTPAQNPQCTGGTPSNAILCSGDDQGLTQDVYRTVVSECTEQRKCEYACNNGFQLSNGQCVPSTSQITSGGWTNMNGVSISQADLNDRVNIRVNGGQLAGKQITITWYKAGQASPIGTITTTANLDSYLIQDIVANISGNIYFKAAMPGQEVTSGNLIVSSTSTNSPPNVDITNPIEGGIYFVNVPIPFSHISTDVDSKISSIQWNFGNGITSSNNSGTRTYTGGGQKTITLTVTDEHGARTVQQKSILVSASPAAYAYIEQPKAGGAIISNNLVVDYSARNSYIIDVTYSGGNNDCTATINCVVGLCPTQSQQSPSCAANKNAKIAVANTPQPYNQANFLWTFKDGNSYLSPESGNGKVTGTKGFSNYGVKDITVKVNYSLNGNNIQSTYTRQFTLFNQRQCSVDGATWNKIENGLITEKKDTLSTIYCAGLDLQAGTNDDCCPAGFSCSTSGTIGCKLTNGAQNQGCGSYATQNACSTDSSNLAMNEVLWDYYNCGESSNGKNVLCSCQWNTQKNACELQKNDRNDSNPIYGTISSCSYTTQTEECVNGYQNVKIDATNVGGATNAECVDSTQVIPCGRPVVALPFFTLANSIIAILLIVIIYVIIRNKKGNKGIKKK